VQQWIRRLVREDAGQDLVEYALLAALIAAVSVAALNGLGTTVFDFYTKLTGAIPKV
jgi:pilus assembly protein Flp/PilA